MHLCLCGCGQSPKEDTSCFVHGHYWRGSKSISIEEYRAQLIQEKIDRGEGRRKRGSEELRKWLSEFHKTRQRKPRSDETKRKLSEANKGKPSYTRTPESIAKFSAKMKGRKKSEEHCKHIGDSKRGLVHSEEHRHKNSVGVRKAYEEGRMYAGMGRISGTYKGIGFRSTCELAFLIDYYDTGSIIRADGLGLLHLKIKYNSFDNKPSRYSPDYFDSTSNIFYEVKPIGYETNSFLYNDDVKLKEKVAIEYCKEKGWTYKIVGVPLLNKVRVIFPMRKYGIITLTKKCEKQYQEWLISNS